MIFERADCTFSSINEMVVRLDHLVIYIFVCDVLLHNCGGFVVHYVQLRFAVACFEIVVHIFVDSHCFYIASVFFIGRKIIPFES